MRARALELQIATIRRAPSELRALVDQAEATARARLGNLRDALIDGADLRAVFGRLFPRGLQFFPDRIGDRKVWRLEGAAALGRVAVDEADHHRAPPLPTVGGSRSSPTAAMTPTQSTRYLVR
jgi:hypothetical protein